MSACQWRLSDGVALFPVGDEVLIFDDNEGRTHLMADDAARVIRFLFTREKSTSPDDLAADFVTEVCLALEAEGLVTRAMDPHAA